MVIVGDAILAVVNFLVFPTWHLVILYILLLLLIAWSILKSMGF